jgi:NAD(P)-dependent dehydrogenase (short-subunit alcohol dehydrogenase family)
MEMSASKQKQEQTMYYPDFSLKGKVALITGGRRGMGRAIALVFAQAGADVAIGDIEDAEKTAQEIGSLGRRSLAVRVDTSVAADVESMVGKIVNELGTIDILVNGAAIFLTKSLMNMSEEEWDRTLDIDLKGYYLCSRAAAKVMIQKKKGIIINIISNAAKQAYANAGAYSVAKAGAAMLTRVMAAELLPYNIRVNGIGPGPTRTDFNRFLWEDPKVGKQYASTLPFKRMQEAEEITGVALLLASEASSYMTGQVVYSDGGVLLNGPL